MVGVIVRRSWSAASFSDGRGWTSVSRHHPVVKNCAVPFHGHEKWCVKDSLHNWRKNHATELVWWNQKDKRKWIRKWNNIRSHFIIINNHIKKDVYPYNCRRKFHATITLFFNTFPSALKVWFKRPIDWNSIRIPTLLDSSVPNSPGCTWIVSSTCVPV